MTDAPLHYLEIHDLSAKIRERAVSPVEVVEAHLHRIEALDPDLFSFITVCPDRAVDMARKAEAEIAGGRYRGPLHGIPYGAKDIIDTAGIRTTHGSSFFRDNVPSTDAECIARLDAAGAILLGKTHTHEFAAASTTINPHYGTTRNPWNRDRIVGGSSGGSAAALAARMCPAAIGTDTGGSIRAPAAMCGVVGLKPTHGRVSLRGVCPNVPSYDNVGPMARSARDAALLLQVLAGFDPLDPMARDAAVPDYLQDIENGVAGARILLCPDFYCEAETDDAVGRAFAEAGDVLRDLGARLDTVAFPEGERFVRLFKKIAGPEFAEFHRPFHARDPSAYGEDIRDRLAWSVAVTTDEYVRGLRERELLCRAAADRLGGADAMILPGFPCSAPAFEPLVAEINGKSIEFAEVHRPFLSAHNISGCPALVTPMGFDAKGLPLSLQVVAGPWREADVLRVAHAFEGATAGIRARRPPGM